MERILVSMDARHGAWEAWSRAISLARRIDARVYALLVIPPGMHGGANGDAAEAGEVRRRLELLIEAAKSGGIAVDYFVSEGKYEEEVIKFVEHNRITLMVAESPEGEVRHSDRELAAVRKIRHRVSCRMELVSPRKLQNLQA